MFRSQYQIHFNLYQRIMIISKYKLNLISLKYLAFVIIYFSSVWRKMHEVYHEKQSLQLCALHVLNNIFQEQRFSKADLDKICETLSQNWINPHRSFFGLGNFDVNVIMFALQEKGFEAKWFDKRRTLSALEMDNIFGFILNVPNSYKALGLIPLPGFSRKHWIALKKLEDGYYNLDSNLKVPLKFSDEQAFKDFIESELAAGGKELLVVVSKDVAETNAWQTNHSEGVQQELTVKLPKE